MARTKGAVGKGVDNKAVREYLLAHGPLSHQPKIVDHSIRGAKGQEKDSHRYSSERILAILRQLDYIDVTTVFSQMQSYNISRGNEKTPSLRNVQRITKVLRCASEGIRFHAEKWYKSEYDSGTAYVDVVNFSNEEREKFRKWAIAGEMEKAKALVESCGMVTTTHERPKMKNPEGNIIDFPSKKWKRELVSLTQIIKDIGNRYTLALEAA